MFSLLTSLLKPFIQKDAVEDSPTSTPPPLYLFNTLSKEKEVFVPLKQSSVGIYSCGPTVYDYAHIGNLRSYVFADILRRVLEYNNYTVKHIINITDVGHLVSDQDEGDDKMSLALKREGKDFSLAEMKKLGTKYTKAFKEDLQDLNIKTPEEFPRASEHIDGQIAFIKTLEEKGYAYTLKDGVYFDTAMFESYGALGGVSKEEAETVARIKKNVAKKHSQDFALWKFNPELGWDAPWGKGFPGWHIECTAMSTQYLGKQFDIHTGGIDHIPIHHNNEIAQTEAVTGKQFVKYWLHNAFITIEQKRIGKSEGNSIYLRHIKEKDIPPFAYRYWLLTGHYRTHMNFTWSALEASHTALIKLHKQFLDLGSKNGKVNTAYKEKFLTLVNDDLNTPQGVALLWELMGDDTVEDKDKRATVLDFNRVLGIGFIESYRQMKNMLRGESRKVTVIEAPKAIQVLVEKRETARKEEDWDKADKLREKLEEKGYSISDTESGPELEKK